MFMLDLTACLSVIEVKGLNSKEFLQGQLTNDINQLDNNNFQFAAHLNNKGRMLASFIVIKPEENTYYLITPSEIIEKLLPRLKMFVLRSKVTITPLKSYIIFSNYTLPATYKVKFKDNYFLALLNDLPEATQNAQTKWKKFLINYGFPLIYSSTQELLIPQQVNYDLLGGISFKKGCYTGQEIVARMHYLGKVKRRMYRFICDYPVSIGQKVISPKLDNQEIGIIVEATARERDYLGLVSLQIDCFDHAFLDVSNTQQLLIQSITY